MAVGFRDFCLGAWRRLSDGVRSLATELWVEGPLVPMSAGWVCIHSVTGSLTYISVFIYVCIHTHIHTNTYTYACYIQIPVHIPLRFRVSENFCVKAKGMKHLVLSLTDLCVTLGNLRTRLSFDCNVPLERHHFSCPVVFTRLGLGDVS